MKKNIVICFRSYARGRAVPILRMHGWKIKFRGDKNNRNGFDFLLFNQTKDNFLKYDWNVFKKRGLQGIAVWMTQEQIEQNKSMTDEQWNERIEI